jgi:hypothetical protein
LSGTYVLSEPSGSVVLRLRHSEPMLSIWEYAIEVRDADGDIRAELPLTESSLGDSTHRLLDTAPLLSLVKRLVAAIEDGDKAAEDVAEAILRDAEQGNQ